MIGSGKLYFVVNKDLNMSAGKVAAQVGHAASRIDVGTPRTVIVLEGTTEQITNLNTYLNGANIPNGIYIDEGVNEVPPMSKTVLAFGMVEDNFEPDFIKGFELYVDPTPYKLDNEVFKRETAEHEVRHYRRFYDMWLTLPERIRKKYGGR